MSTPSTHVAGGLAGPGAARAAKRRDDRIRRKKSQVGNRPGWVTYAILAVVMAVSAYPLYYSFLLGSSDPVTIAQNPIPSLIPQGNFIDNVGRVISSDIKFWQAVLNSVIAATIMAASVVFFSTLAGFAFAKLRFRGRGPLLVFVVATMLRSLTRRSTSRSAGESPAGCPAAVVAVAVTAARQRLASIRARWRRCGQCL